MLACFSRMVKQKEKEFVSGRSPHIIHPRGYSRLLVEFKEFGNLVPGGIVSAGQDQHLEEKAPTVDSEELVWGRAKGNPETSLNWG